MYKNFRKWVEETYPEGEPSDNEWEEITEEDENPLAEPPTTPSDRDSPLSLLSREH